MTRNYFFAGLLLFAISTDIHEARAHPPSTINYQGRLLDSSGNAITGQRSVTFSAWSAASGGSQLWSETQTVTVSTGNYSVALGSSVALSTTVFTSANTYLQIQVGSDPAMTPRLQFQTAPYAFTAQSMLSFLPFTDLLSVVPVSVTVSQGSGYTVPSGKNFLFGADVKGCDLPGTTFSNGQDADIVLGQANFTSAGAAATQGGMSSPHSVAFDSSGNLWMSDNQNNRVLKFTPPFSSGMNASNVLGQANFTSNGAATTQSGLQFPAGATLDSSGNLWVCDNANNRVLKFTSPFSDGMNASLVLGKPDFTTNTAGVTQSTMSAPHGVAFDSSGNLWVADKDNSRVLKFTSPFSNGMNASLVLGQANFTSLSSAATQSGLALPVGLAFDSSGNLWVADRGNSRVLKFTSPFSDGMNASLVLGQAVFTTSTTATTASGMSSPRGVAFDVSGNLWVSEADNKRVLKFSPPFSTAMSASLVLGQANFTSAAGATTQSGLAGPQSLTIDASSNTWVMDLSNNRVLKYIGNSGGSSGKCHLSVSGGHSATSLPLGFAGPGDVLASTATTLSIALQGGLFPANATLVLQDLSASGGTYTAPAGANLYFGANPVSTCSAGISLSIGGFTSTAYSGILPAGQTLTNNTACVVTLNGWLR